LWKATESITRTRDGLLRAAVPNPIGSCCFINDLTKAELDEHLAIHKAICHGYPRGGDGEDMYIPTATAVQV
jgi:demethyl-4-deoxygadusol synthase